MSLTATLNLSKTALAVTQAALQTTGNNIANVGDPNYTRQVAETSPSPGRSIGPGKQLGTGVQLDAVARKIDEALEGRLRASVADGSAAESKQAWLGRVESVFNELSDDDLSTKLSKFFNSWSELANAPGDAGARQIVLQEGGNLADRFGRTVTQLDGLRRETGNRMEALAGRADDLAKQVADLNKQIAVQEGGAGGANALRDQRDAALKKLSELVDTTVRQDSTGVVNVYVGSTPVVLGNQSRGIALRTDAAGDRTTPTLVTKIGGDPMQPRSGELGALVGVQAQIDGVTDHLNDLAGGLIYSLNKLHAAGQGIEGLASAAATNTVDDPAAALNAKAAGLKFPPKNGSFVVHVKDKATGLVNSTLVQVDLDGVGADTSLDSLAADLSGIPNLTAAVADGKLSLKADSAAVDFSFSQDSSGALASLGLNGFFTGTDARDIGVSAALVDHPLRLAAARNGQPGDNQTARAIADLESAAGTLPSGLSLKEGYQSIINGIATGVAAAKSDADAAATIHDTLSAQRESLSGVSLDEEAANLLRYQRAFQAASRVVATVDEMLKTVIGLV